MLADGEGGGKRTLDLQAHSHDEVSVWTRYFRQVVERGQLEAHARRVAMRAQPREAFLEIASQAWRHDPNTPTLTPASLALALALDPTPTHTITPSLAGVAA